MKNGGKKMKPKIGDLVMVDPDITPTYGWGSVDKGDVGVFREYSDTISKEVHVDFPKQKGWCGTVSDLILISTTLMNVGPQGAMGPQGLPGAPGQTGETNMKTKAGTSWSFDSIATLDVDYSEIARELCKANPLAIISAEGKDGDSYGVMVHEFLVTKAEVCSLPMPIGKTITVDNCLIVKTTKENFSNWISWAKVVKGASWPKKFKRKAKVTVTLAHI